MNGRTLSVILFATAILFAIAGPVPVAALGTTNPIYLPLPAGTPDLEPGNYYYVVSIYNAQAAYMGKSWEKAYQVLVTSEVAMDNPPQTGAKTIQRLKRVIKNKSVLLGLSDNLIDPTPAIASSLRISISYVVSPHSKLAELESGINGDALCSPFSLAPGVLPVVRGLTRVTDAILKAFSDGPSGPAPILDFSTSFTLPRKDLKDGYYVVFGSYDNNYPLPMDLSGGNIKVEPNAVLIDSKPVTDLSYIVLMVSTFPRRGWQTGQGPWCARLQKAYGIMSSAKHQTTLSADERRKRYDDCIDNIEAASALFEADPSYLLCEKSEIIDKAYQEAQAILPSITKSTNKSISLDPVGVKLTGCKTVAQLNQKVKSADALLSRSDKSREWVASLMNTRSVKQMQLVAEAQNLEKAQVVAEAQDLTKLQEMAAAQAQELEALKSQMAAMVASPSDTWAELPPADAPAAPTDPPDTTVTSE